MNNMRRKSIREAYDKLRELMETIESIKDEEQEAYDNLPESFQDGSRGEAMSEAIDSLESAGSSIEEALDYLESSQN